MPHQVQRSSEDQQQQEHAVIERKDTQCTPGKKGTEITLRPNGVEEDARNQETGQRKEERNANPKQIAYIQEKLDRWVRRNIVCKKEVTRKDCQDCQPANPIQRKNVPRFGHSFTASERRISRSHDIAKFTIYATFVRLSGYETKRSSAHSTVSGISTTA